MLTSFALVKNMSSSSEELLFSSFKLAKIRRGDTDGLRRSQRLFPKAWPLFGDWVYERRYDDSHEWERIPFDVENTLLLLRLFKTGDLVFLPLCIENSEGELSHQKPYRVMSYIHTTHKYQIESEECPKFDTFSSEITSQINWSSTWFQTVRRFFLYGGGKEYNPIHNEVDRIVDYIIALEATLVPEKDFVGRRLRERAVSLLIGCNIDSDDTKRLLRDFYRVRSAIAHGDDISSFKHNVLKRNIEFETIVRKVIVEAIKVLPVDDINRKGFLQQLFDVCDLTRVDKVFSDFCSIKNKNERKKCFNLISKRL